MAMFMESWRKQMYTFLTLILPKYYAKCMQNSSLHKKVALLQPYYIHNAYECQSFQAS
jgi:hypothetical protein